MLKRSPQVELLNMENDQDERMTVELREAEAVSQEDFLAEVHKYEFVYNKCSVDY